MDERLLQALSDLDNSAGDLTDTTVAAALEKALGKGEAPGSADLEGKAELMAFRFSANYPEENHPWPGHYFGPVMSGKDASGTIVCIPDIAEVRPETLDYWQKRSQESKHPYLRARYADLVWDLSRFVRNKSSDVVCPRSAIDGYCETVERRLYKYGFTAHQRIRRALHIAAQIGDKDRLTRVSSAIISLDQEPGKNGLSGERGLAFSLLLDNDRVDIVPEAKKKIIEAQESILVAVLESARSAKDLTMEGVKDPFLGKAAAERLAAHYRKHELLKEAHRVLRVYKEIFALLAPRTSALVATTWLQDVHKILRDYGMREDTEEVAVLLREQGKRVPSEMKTISTEFEIKKEELNAMVDEVFAGSLAEGLARIAANFIPREGETRRQLEDLSITAPLQAVISHSIVDYAGRTVARVGSVQDDLEGRIVFQTAQGMHLMGFFLHRMIEELKARSGGSMAAVVDEICRSPLFAEDRRDILKLGLDAYFNQDHIVALHLLIPQIEQALRTLLELGKVSIYKPHRHEGFTLKNLDDIFREPIVGEVFGSDFQLYGRVLFTDQRGLNLRNDLCHGILAPNSMGAVLSDRVFHVILCLGGVRTGDGM